MSRFAGNVEVTNPDGMVSGWAIDIENSGVPLELAALVDGVPVATVTCGASRPDVKAAGFPTEFAGFRFHLPHTLFDGETHTLSFKLAGGSEELPLHGKTTILLTPAPVGEVLLSPDRESLKGWIAMPESGVRAVLLDVLLDGKLLEVRPIRVPTNSTENGRIPISIPLPKRIVSDPISHRIDVRLAGNGRRLEGSPVSSRTSKLIGAFDLLCGRRVVGWAYDEGLMLVPVLDVYCGERHVMQLECGSHRKDLTEKFGISAGGFDAWLPQGAFDDGSESVSIRFSDGKILPGGPKGIQAADRELERLEATLRGVPAISGTPRIANAERLKSLLEDVSQMIMVYPESMPDNNKIRGEAIALSYELLTEIFFSGDTSTAFAAVRGLSMLGINICRHADDFRRLVPVLCAEENNLADVFGLIDLQRQRRRPFASMLLAAVLLSRGRTKEGSDLIFDCYWSGKGGERAVTANLGVILLMQAGLAADAENLFDMGMAASLAAVTP